MIKYLLTISILISQTFCNQSSKSYDSIAKTTEPRLKGLNFVAVPEPFPENPMPEVKAISADWIALIPYGFTRLGQPSVQYNTKGWQWWGERPEGIEKSIELAHEAQIHVMLKPQIYVPDGFTGALDFKTDEEWASWEADYEHFMMIFANIAQQKKVEILCVGTEFKISTQKREAFWRGLIAKIKTVYRGKLIYAANWDEYAAVPFWDALDYAGVNAYFPLLPDKTPSVRALKTAWEKPVSALAAFAKQHQKQIIFTEFGYMSLDECASPGWEVEAKKDKLNINEVAQANALEALLTTFSAQPWWQGGFLWKWFPNMQGHEGYPEKDYTPQGKKAAKVVKYCFEKM
jgi:hypothetical protein